MNKSGLNGSAIGNFLALSPVQISSAGSSGASNLGDYGWMNVTVAADSADLAVYIQRSATSNGTFNSVGSMPGNASKLSVRGFALESSCNWYRAAYVPTGNTYAIIQFSAQGARKVPITQPANTTVYSDVIP